MIPKHTSVRVKNSDDEHAGLTGFVIRVYGDVAPDGYEIPKGWCEVVFDPLDTHGFHAELYRDDELTIYGC